MARLVVTKSQLRKEGKNWSIDATEVYETLSKILDRTTAEALKDKPFMQAGMVLRDRVKQLAPYKTGLLRGNVFAAPGDTKKPDVLVGVSRKRKGGAPHGILLEYGTSRMKPHPFFRPAIAETRQQVAQILITGMAKAIEDAAK